MKKKTRKRKSLLTPVQIDIAEILKFYGATKSDIEDFLFANMEWLAVLAAEFEARNG